MKRTSVDWPLVPLSQIAEFRNGVNYDKSSFGEGIKVVGVKNFQDLLVVPYDKLDQINPVGVVTTRDLLQDGDIVFVRSNGNRDLIGRSLYVAQPPVEVTFSGFTIRARFTSAQAWPQFFAYLFRSPIIRKQLAAYGGGTNISNLNQKVLGQLAVPLPELAEQRQIVGILSAYDKRIENGLRRIGILEEMARAFYREWFVKFRIPNCDLEPRTQSSVGPIPKGWHVRRLNECCSFTMGFSPPSDSYNDRGEGLPFHQGVRDFGPRFPVDRLYCTADGRMAQAGDVLFSVRAPVGRMNLATHQLIMGRGISAIRRNSGHQAFLWEQLRDKFHEENSMGGGSIFAAVTKAEMGGIELLDPPGELMERATRVLQPIHDLIATLSLQSDNLGRTRDLLLQRLLSGDSGVVVDAA